MESRADTGLAREAEHQLLDELLAEIDRLERIENMMRTILLPVLTGQDTPKEAMVPGPEEVPMHSYHDAIIRLRRMNNRLEDLRSVIRL